MGVWICSVFGNQRHPNISVPSKMFLIQFSSQVYKRIFRLENFVHFTLAIICLLLSKCMSLSQSPFLSDVLFQTVNHKPYLKGTNHSYFLLVEGNTCSLVCKVNVFSELVCTKCIWAVIGNRATSLPGSALTHVYDSALAKTLFHPEKRKVILLL